MLMSHSINFCVTLISKSGSWIIIAINQEMMTRNYDFFNTFTYQYDDAFQKHCIKPVGLKLYRSEKKNWEQNEPDQ